MTMLATRRAALDEVVKDKIRKRVREILDQKKDNGADEDEKSDAGSIILFDDYTSKTARIAGRIVATVFDTKDELERYLKDHPDADRSMHSVKPKKEKGPAKEEAPKERKQPGKEEEKGKGRKPGEEEPKDEKGKPKEQEKKPEGEPKEQKKPEEPSKKPGDSTQSLSEQLDTPVRKLPKDLPPEGHPTSTQKPHERAVAIKDALIDMMGEKAKDWSVHSVDPSQLKDEVKVVFPDGQTKTYGELSDKEKQRVKDAISSGLAATKGMNDYTSVSTSAVRGNMRNNLAQYDDSSVEETKVTSKEPVSRENAGKTAEAVRTNGRNLVRKYAKALSKVSRPMAERYVDDVADAIHEGLSDGSLAGMSQADLDEFVREDLKRIIHQEIETRGRSLGDHGMRHVAGNVRSAMDMLGELQQHGFSVTGKQKLMAIATMANHDLGYTVGEVATDIKQGKRHVEQSKQLADEESERYERIFGASDGKKIRDMIATHDSTDIDWERDPMASAVRLADNTALFGKDKVQDLFIRSPKAVRLAAKLRMAAEMIPVEPKAPDRKDFKSDEEFASASESYAAKKKAYDEQMADPEVQKRVARSKQMQKDIKKQLHDTVEEMDVETFSDAIALHAQIDEMSEGKFSTSRDILSRLSGKLKGFKFDPERKMMRVDMAYSPEGEMMQALFGDEVAAAQFDKFAKDMKAKPLKGNRGKVTFSNPEGKKVFEMDVEGFDEEPIDTATTGAMREFLKSTARGELRQAAGELSRPGAGPKEVEKAKKTMEKAKDKFTDREWEMLMKAMEEGKDVAALAKKLGAWPLLEAEMAFLEAKTAAVLRRIAVDVAMGVIAERVAARGLQVNRKDRDTMSDTGGTSKHPHKEPDFKPPREDNKHRFRTRNLTKEEKDPDVNRDRDRTSDPDMRVGSDFTTVAARELARWPRRFEEMVSRMLR